MTNEEIITAVEQMNVLDLANLVKALQDRFGVVAAAPAAAAPAAVAVAPVAPVEEQTEFTVMLKEFGANKINVIKVVRELTGLGLREAKELVEGAPKPVKESVPKEEADKAAAKLKDAGATVEVK